MQNFILPIAMVLVFTAIVLGVQALATAVLSSRARNQRVNRRLTLLESGIPSKDVYESLIRRAPSTRGGDLITGLGLYLGQAGLRISALRLLAYGVGGTVGLWLVSIFVLSNLGATASIKDIATTFVAAAAMVSASIWVVVSRLHTRRKKQLEEQLPLALDIVVRAIRAGHPVVSAVQLVTQEMGDPIGSEFGLIVDETTYGFEFREALKNFARRTGSEDAHFFAVSVGIQSETGGNLAEILMNLTNVIRGRITLGKRVQALASEGKMSAIVLSILPIFLISFVGLTQPTFYTSKFSDPIFWPVAIVTGVLYGIGQVVMNRIVNFKY